MLPAARTAAAPGRAAPARKSASGTSSRAPRATRAGAAAAHSETADLRVTLFLDICFCLAIGARSRDYQLGHGESQKICDQDVERDAAPEDHDRKHRPERDQEKIKEPADSR